MTEVWVANRLDATISGSTRRPARLSARSRWRGPDRPGDRRRLRVGVGRVPRLGDAGRCRVGRVEVVAARVAHRKRGERRPIALGGRPGTGGQPPRRDADRDVAELSRHDRPGACLLLRDRGASSGVTNDGLVGFAPGSAAWTVRRSSPISRRRSPANRRRPDLFVHVTPGHPLLRRRTRPSRRFRRALERVFRLRSDGAFHFAAIDGAARTARRLPRRCDLSRGIVTDDAAAERDVPPPSSPIRISSIGWHCLRLRRASDLGDAGRRSRSGARHRAIPHRRVRAGRAARPGTEPRCFGRGPMLRAPTASRIGLSGSSAARRRPGRADILGGRADLMFREIPPDLLGSLEKTNAGQVALRREKRQLLHGDVHRIGRHSTMPVCAGR